MKTKFQNYFLGRLPSIGLLGLGFTLNAPAESVFQSTLSNPPSGGGAQLSMGRFYFRVEADQVDFAVVIFPFGALPGSLDPVLSVPGESINFALGAGTSGWLHGSHTIADQNPFLPGEPWLPSGYDENGNPIYVDTQVIRFADLYSGHFALPPGFEDDLLAGLGRIDFSSQIGGAITVAAVPEPTTFTLALLAGLGGWGGIRWRKSKALCVAVLLAALSGVAGVARADNIVSSLDNTPVTVIGFSPGSWAASSFQTDNEYWNLSSVTLMLGRGGFSFSTANLRLYSDASGQPGVWLANLGTLTLARESWPSLVTFTLAGGLTLDPSTTYWIALGNISPNQGLNVGLLLDDNGPPPFTFTGAPGASMIRSVASGGGNGINPPTDWTRSGPNGALLFAVDGIPVVVPEPGQLALMLLAGIGLFPRRSSLKLMPKSLPARPAGRTKKRPNLIGLGA